MTRKVCKRGKKGEVGEGQGKGKSGRWKRGEGREENPRKRKRKCEGHVGGKREGIEELRERWCSWEMKGKVIRYQGPTWGWGSKSVKQRKTSHFHVFNSN